MSLEKFMKKKTNKLLVVDISNIIYRNLYVAHKQDPLDETFAYWKLLVIEELLHYIDKFDVNKCVIALDDLACWRKKIYPEYKGNRKKSRDKSKIDFKVFFPIMNSFLEEIKNTFESFYFIKVDTCEADDVIAVLTKERWDDYKIVCLSNDSDLNQLIKYKNYSQFNPLQRKFFNPINYKKDLMIKIVMGDRGDNIFGIVDRCGPATAKKMLDKGLDEVFESDENAKKIFERNKKLIDLNLIPNDITKKICDVYDNYNINKCNGNKIYKFFVNNNLFDLMGSLEKNTKNLMQMI